MGQFIVYTSSDASGPGTLSGPVGTLLSILDACLVNGYTGKAAAGWSKPFANSGNMGCYKQGTGSGSAVQYNLVINDNAGTPGVPQEALATGYATLTNITAPTGTGTGSFPATGQTAFSTNCTIIRKANNSTATAIPWVIYADSRTFYMFIKTGDVASTYLDFMFGDFFSMAGSSDVNRGMIIGRNAANSVSAGTANGNIDRMLTPYATSGTGGAWMANNFAGSSGSLLAYTFGDIGKGTTSTLVSGFSALAGPMPTPNSFDNSYYMAPVLVTDSSWGIRGQLRGLYHMCHPVSAFSDGQTFSGANDFAGKSFVMQLKGIGGGMFCIETSNTVATN